MFYDSPVLFGSCPKFLSSSDIQAFARSDVSTSHEAGLYHYHFRAAAMLTVHDGAVSSIDKEIDAARQHIRFLLSRRNILMPISALPPELLSRIFHLHALQEPPCFRKQKLGWIGVTHVCRHWRQVALNDSSLWARIGGVSPRAQWVSKMLVRARNAPLAIDMVSPSLEILSMFPPHISHIRELRLTNMNHSQGIQEICSLEAPALEHFELRVSVAAPVAFCQLAGTTLFNGQAPKLRTFSLYQISIPWSLIPRGQLTQLKVNTQGGIIYPDISSPSDSLQLIDLLIDSPDLEVLALEFCIPTMLSQVSRGQSIYLPRLSRLCLGGSTATVTNLLKMLKLPSSASLHLNCISENSSTHAYHLVLPVISAHFHNPNPVEFKSLRVIANCLKRLIDVAAFISPLTSTIDRPSVPDSDIDGTAKLSLRLSFGGVEFGVSTQADILRRMCSLLPISNLEVLSISSPDDLIQSVNWYKLFQQCINVTTIHAKGRGTIGLLQALAPPKATDTAGTCATTTPFPKLTSLLLEDLNFNTEMPSSDTLYSIFIPVLLRRKMNSMALNVLGIKRCVIVAQYANSLKKYVQEVCWDGNKSGSHYDTPGDVLRGPTQTEWGDFTGYNMVY